MIRCIVEVLKIYFFVGGYGQKKVFGTYLKCLAFSVHGIYKNVIKIIIFICVVTTSFFQKKKSFQKRKLSTELIKYYVLQSHRWHNFIFTYRILF